MMRSFTDILVLLMCNPFPSLEDIYLMTIHHPLTKHEPSCCQYRTCMTHSFLGWPDWNFPFNTIEVKKSETINGWQNATGFFWTLLNRAMFVFFFFYKWAGPVENSHSGPQVSDHWLNDPPLLCRGMGAQG